jgi:tetratricopeptide (TPR) repeat protein
MTGSRLGHYRVGERIGAGGMGEVYRAHDERLQRDVAIKVLPPSSVGDSAARSRLLREARERNPIGWLVLGWSHLAQGRHVDAIAAHERAAELRPPLKFELARTYALIGRRDDAGKIRVELEAAPPTPFGVFGLGTLQTTLGNFDEAFGSSTRLAAGEGPPLCPRCCSD